MTTFVAFFYLLLRQYSRYRQRIQSEAAKFIGVKKPLTIEALSAEATVLYSSKLVALEQSLGFRPAKTPIQPVVHVIGQASSGKTSFMEQQQSITPHVRIVSVDEENEASLVLLFVDAAAIAAGAAGDLQDLVAFANKRQDRLMVLINKADLLGGNKQAILQVFGRAMSLFGGAKTRVYLTAFGASTATATAATGNGGDEWAQEFRANEQVVQNTVFGLDALAVLRARAQDLKKTAQHLLKEESNRGWLQSRPKPVPGEDKLNVARTRYTSAKQLEDIVRQLEEEVEPALADLAAKYIPLSKPTVLQRLGEPAADKAEAAVSMAAKL